MEEGELGEEPGAPDGRAVVVVVVVVVGVGGVVVVGGLALGDVAVCPKLWPAKSKHAKKMTAACVNVSKS